MWRVADVLVISAALTTATEGLTGARELGLMNLQPDPECIGHGERRHARLFLFDLLHLDGESVSAMGTPMALSVSREEIPHVQAKRSILAKYPVGRIPGLSTRERRFG